MRNLLFLMLVISFSGYGQLTTPELEKQLTKHRRDSLNGWRLGGALVANGSNTGLVNWAAGGENSLSLNGAISGYANLRIDSARWDNSLLFGYGIMRQGESGWLKTDDRIDFNSQYSRNASKTWFYSALLNFRTQMNEGYNYPNDSVKISTFFAPAYVITATGMKYQPNKNFGMFIAPITSKLTFVGNQDLADQGAFGVEEATYDATTGLKITDGRRFRSELGGYIRTRLTLKLAENIKFNTNLDLFSNYLENPQNIDVNWESTLDIKLWKIITISFLTHLIYDDDVDITLYDDEGNITGKGPRVQFKHLTAVGLKWNFDN